jgi:hypothetical protein
MLDPRAQRALVRLLGDGVVRRDGERIRTARRFQRAMTRAAFHLFGKGDPGDDLRVPIAFALLEIYGDDCTDEDLAQLVEIMLPIEQAELSPGAPPVVSGGAATAG